MTSFNPQSGRRLTKFGLLCLLGTSLTACTEMPLRPQLPAQGATVDEDPAVGDDDLVNEGEGLDETENTVVTDDETKAVVPVVPAPPVVSSEGDGRFEVAKKPGFVAEDSKPIDQRPGCAANSFEMKGADSKVFPGAYTRKVCVYLPPNFSKAKEYPFIVGMDADWLQEPLMTTMDTLIRRNKIPAMIGVFVNNGGGDSIGSQRGKEYDLLGPNNGKFLETEVLATIEAKYGVKFTKNPQGGAAFGGSSSGVAAFTLAWFYTQRFTKVLSYSATLTAQGKDGTYPKGGYEYGEHIIADEATVKPIRVTLQYGSNDYDFGQYLAQSVSNEMAYKALVAKGYHVRLHVGQGAGHVDGDIMNQTMAENMVWLWRDYPRN